MREVREYQTTSIKTAFAWIKAGNKRFVMESPTGSGKSVIAALIAEQAIRQGIIVVFAAHRIELLSQAREKLVEAGLHRDQIRMHGKESEGPHDAPVHLGSVTTLLKHAPRNARLILIDEAHRSASKTYVELVEMFPDATVIGFTATPERLDGRAIDVFNDILVVAKPSAMIAAGYIVEPSTWSADSDHTPDLSNVSVSMGDYSVKSAAVAMNKPHLVGNIVDHWKKHAEGLPTICFASSIEHSKAIVQAFIDAGIRAEHIDGKSTDALRFDAKERLKSGATQVVSNFGLWVEGVDIPEAKCCILARPTLSITVYLQSIGRVCRPYEGMKPIVLDHGCNWERFGSMAKDRNYSISGRPKKSRDEVQAAWICPACLFGNDSSVEQCAMCGCDKPKRSVKRKVRTVDGELTEMAPEEETPDFKKQFWNGLWMRSWNLGERPQWVVERYRKRFGENPGNDWAPPSRRARKIDPKDVWNEAQRYRTVAFKMRLRGSMQWDYIRQRIKSKFDLDFPDNMDPVAYAMSLNQDEMAKRRKVQIESYEREGLKAPEPMQFGASTIIPYEGIEKHFADPNAPAPPAPQPLPPLSLELAPPPAAPAEEGIVP